MFRNLLPTVLFAVALSLSGCSSSNNAPAPSSSGGSAGTGAAATTPTDTTGAPRLGTGTFQPDPVTPGQPTGTVVGQKVESLRASLIKLDDSVSAQNQTLQSLRAQSIQNAGAYHQLVSAVNAKLEVGTTPGNPTVVGQWNQAQGELGKVNDTLSGMNSLANDVAANAAMSNYLLESTRAAFGIFGAVDEDHAQLRILEDEVNRTTVLIDRLLSELTEDISRQTNYLAEERGNLNTLAIGVNKGEAFGRSLSSNAYAQPVAPAMAPGSGIASGRPLVVIRFDKSNPDYQQALYQAVSQALARRPNVAFDLVAVAPSGSGPAQTALNANMARRDADGVLRALIGMGLSPDRVSMSSATSPAAQVDEVHLYVR